MSRYFAALLCVSFFLCAEEPLPSLELGPVVDSIALLPDPFVESISSAPISLASGELAFPEPLVEVKKTKSPGVAALLSSLIPGLGHYYLGDFRTGSEVLGGTLLGGAGAYTFRKDPPLFITSVYTMQAVSLYGVYAAYRDAKLYNGNPLATMPRENFKSLSAAPFQWSVLKKPEVWGGFLGTLAVGASVVYFGYSKAPAAQIQTTYIEPVKALPIAIGEEALFRGFLQTYLNESMPAWSAITLSSLAFGAAHIPNALALEESTRWRYYTFSLPFITSLGAYMGWMTHKNRSLKESVALHAWYDFTLMCTGALASKAAIGKETRLFYSFDF